MAIASLVGCAGSVRTVPRAPEVASYELSPVVDTLPPSVTVTATGPDSYNAPLPAVDAPGVLLDAFHAALPGVNLVHDARLDVVALELTRVPAELDVSKGLLGFELASHGIAEPPIGVARGPDGDPTAVVTALLPRLKELSAYSDISLGVARDNDHAVIVVAHRQRFIGDRIPRELATMARVEISGTLVDGYRNPTLTVAPDTRAPFRVSFAQRGDRYQTAVSCVLARTLWLTITARDHLGDEPILASFPIACGTATPSTYTAEVQAAVATTDVPRRLAALINRNRVAAGLTNLAGDVRAQRAARAWAFDMRRAEQVAHAIDGATSVSRLRDHGLVPARSSHLAFHADNLQEAIELLENNDAYRAILLDREMTDIGLAVMPDPHGGDYVSIELVQIPPRIDAAAERQRLHDRAEKALAAENAVWRSNPLDALAQWYADELAVGWSAQALEPLLERKARFWRVPPFRAAVRNPTRVDELDVASLIPPSGAHSVGVGLTQALANSAFADRIFVAVFFAR